MEHLSVIFITPVHSFTSSERKKSHAKIHKKSRLFLLTLISFNKREKVVDCSITALKQSL